MLAPLVRSRKGHYKELFEQVRKKGYLYVRVDGELREVTHGMKLDRYKNHDIEVVIDKLIVADKDDKRLKQSVATAMRQGDGLLMILDAQTENIRHYSKLPDVSGHRIVLSGTGSSQLLVQLSAGSMSEV